MQMQIDNIRLEVVRSDRSTIALQLKRDGSAVIRAPRFASEAGIRAFALSHADWLKEHIQKQNASAPAPEEMLSSEEIRALAAQALKELPPRIRAWAEKVGVSYGRVTIRNQRTKWGSCSAAGNLNFNCLIMLAPHEVQDYLIVHELCHRLEMNHSPRFWKEVARVLPDYRDSEKWLKTQGTALMRRMTG